MFILFLLATKKIWVANKRDKYVQESLPLDFNTNKPSEVEKLIKEKNILEMTPMEAINFLYDLKGKIK